MSESPPTRRRWFQFGLGTVLLVVTVAAALAFGIKERVERIRLEKQLQGDTKYRMELEASVKDHEAAERLFRRRIENLERLSERPSASVP